MANLSVAGSPFTYLSQDELDRRLAGAAATGASSRAHVTTLMATKVLADAQSAAEKASKLTGKASSCIQLSVGAERSQINEMWPDLAGVETTPEEIVAKINAMPGSTAKASAAWCDGFSSSRTISVIFSGDSFQK